MGALRLPYFSAEAYLDFDRKCESKNEYLDGVIIAMAGGSPRHAMLSMRIGILIGGKLESGKCTAYSPDLRVELAAKRSFAYPDFTVVCGPEQYSSIAPDTITNPALVVEILSSSTESYDTGAKAAMYHAIRSLQDLLLIHHNPVFIEHHSRQSPTAWRIETIDSLDAVIELRSVNQTLRVADIFAGIPTPPSSSNPLE